MRELATGELTSVTLRSGESFNKEAAFLAHFVARSCRNHVTVHVIGELGRTDIILSAGGGLGPYEVKEITRQTEEAGGEERGLVLALAGLGLQEEALVLLMEGALAARQDAVLTEHNNGSVGGDAVGDKEAAGVVKDGGKSPGLRGKVLGSKGGDKSPMASSKRRGSIGAALGSSHGSVKMGGGSLPGSVKVGRLAADGSMLKAVLATGGLAKDQISEDFGPHAGAPKLDIRGLEINGNPLLGRGGRDAMILVVQLGMLSAGLVCVVLSVRMDARCLRPTAMPDARCRVTERG